MIIEHIKTACLWVLILSSVTLTYSLWTYQPEYSTLGSAEPIETPEIGEERNASDILMPKSITVHDGTDRLWMEPGGDRYSSQMSSLRDISFGRPIAESRQNIPSMYKHEHALDFRFSTPIPARMMEQLFDFDLGEEESFPLENIDRIHLSANGDSDFDSEVVARFISYSEGEVRKAETGLSESGFRALYESESDALYAAEGEVFGNMRDGEYAYLPIEPPNMEEYTTHLNNSIRSEDYKQLLFSDPSTVLEYSTNVSNTSYQDGNRFLTFSRQGSGPDIMKFEYPVSGDPDESSRSMASASLNFLNSHGGFTDDFYLDDVTEYVNRDRAVYRLAMDETPVLGGSSRESLYYTKLVERSGEQITRYDRSLYRLDENYQEAGTMTSLESLDYVRNFIASAETIVDEDAGEIRIGYHMDSNTGALIIFSPSWFINVNGQWFTLEQLEDTEEEYQESGGDPEDGLEQS
ncbi:hypothetical protein CR205_17870 [Alteribacter lacisalsi]|uniref:Regulatory protein YycH domain-containing protein n=1 Tax=Alteribacter lacisalsi TaxID=2045244 RepID=A0A2W0H4Z5_9BACI|nr:two-component system activity regulator YycH [Alteribacter lacisalsi]PYZ96227.1 hypothetical protein CR205_17870 [Alteribacter lacisalsi]